jgi:hypothetical protein
LIVDFPFCAGFFVKSIRHRKILEKDIDILFIPFGKIFGRKEEEASQWETEHLKKPVVSLRNVFVDLLSADVRTMITLAEAQFYSRSSSTFISTNNNPKHCLSRYSHKPLIYYVRVHYVYRRILVKDSHNYVTSSNVGHIKNSGALKCSLAPHSTLQTIFERKPE